MTVKELLEELEKVEDKSRIIYIESDGVLSSVCLDNGLHAVLLFGHE